MYTSWWNFLGKWLDLTCSLPLTDLQYYQLDQILWSNAEEFAGTPNGTHLPAGGAPASWQQSGNRSNLEVEVSKSDRTALVIIND